MLNPHAATHYHLTRLSDTSRLFWAHGIYSLGSSLVLVFVPIFLLKMGLSFQTVLVYLVLQGLFSFLMQYPALKLISRLGASHAMALGLAIQAGFGLMLLTYSQVQWPVWALALPWALNRVLYWPAFHVFFSGANAHHNDGSQVGFLQALVTFSKGAAPAVGGIVATIYGINWLYALSIGLYILAALPLLGHEPPREKGEPRRALSWRRIRRDLVAECGNAITTCAEIIVWPILIFLAVSSYAGVGILSSVIALASIATALYVTRRQKGHGPHHYIRRGVTIASLSDLFRLAAQSTESIFGVNLMGGVGNALYYAPFFSRYYQHADEETRLKYVGAMEITHEAAWTLFFVILLMLSFFLAPNLTLLAGIALAVPANYAIRLIR